MKIRWRTGRNRIAYVRSAATAATQSVRQPPGSASWSVLIMTRVRVGLKPLAGEAGRH